VTYIIEHLFNNATPPSNTHARKTPQEPI